jgi:hypothetical protein
VSAGEKLLTCRRNVGNQSKRSNIPEDSNFQIFSRKIVSMPTLHHRPHRLETGISGWSKRRTYGDQRPHNVQNPKHCHHLEKCCVRQDRNSTNFVISKWNQSLFIGFNSLSQQVTRSYTNLLNKTRSDRYGVYRPKLDSQEGPRFLFSKHLDELRRHPDSDRMGTDKSSRG